MALIKGFKATNVYRAFFLNAIVNTVTVGVALFVKAELERTEHGEDATPNLSSLFIFITLISTFAASLVAYYMLFLVVGYGGGMLVARAEHKLSMQLTPLQMQKLRTGKKVTLTALSD